MLLQLPIDYDTTSKKLFIDNVLFADLNWDQADIFIPDDSTNVVLTYFVDEKQIRTEVLIEPKVVPKAKVDPDQHKPITQPKPELKKTKPSPADVEDALKGM